MERIIGTAEKKEGLYCYSFQENFQFRLPFRPEILLVSARNFQAEWKIMEAEDGGLIFGSYDLLLVYRRFGGHKNECFSKTFPRSFVFVDDRFIWRQEGLLQYSDSNLECRADIDLFLSPPPFLLSSFLKKTGFYPSKVIISMRGEVFLSKALQEKSSINREPEYEQAADSGRHSDLIARESRTERPLKKPVLNAGYYKNYRLFYELLQEEEKSRKQGTRK